MSGKAAVGVQLDTIIIPYICKCPVVFKAHPYMLPARIGWVMLQKKKRSPSTLKQQRLSSHSQCMFTTDVLGTLFPCLLPALFKSEGSGTATCPNIAGAHGSVMVGLTQKLNVWTPNDICHFCSKFISQRKSLVGTDHMTLPKHKGTKHYNPKMCPEGGSLK